MVKSHSFVSSDRFTSCHSPPICLSLPQTAPNTSGLLQIVRRTWHEDNYISQRRHALAMGADGLPMVVPTVVSDLGDPLQSINELEQGT